LTCPVIFARPGVIMRDPPHKFFEFWGRKYACALAHELRRFRWAYEELPLF